jgi:hypothetical protein
MHAHASTRGRAVQLDFTVRSIKPIFEGHSLISLYRGPMYCTNIILYGGAPYKSPKIAEHRAACGGCCSLAARAADTYISSKIAELPGKAPTCGGSPRFSRTSECHS